MRKTTLLIVFLLSASSLLAAGRHRIVGLPTAPPVTVNGQIVDAATKQPVAFVEVQGARDTLRADETGKFSITVPAGVPATLTFTRTGYETLEQTLTISEAGNHTFEMQPLPTATIRTTDGTTRIVDIDSIEFGYAIPFLGTRSGRSVELCRPGAADFSLDYTGINRIIGPAVTTTLGACCATGPLTGARFVLANNEEVTAYFVDSCEHPDIYIFARDHVTWRRFSVSMSEIAEVIVP